MLCYSSVSLVGALEVIVTHCSNYTGLRGESNPMSPHIIDIVAQHVSEV